MVTWQICAVVGFVLLVAYLLTCRLVKRHILDGEGDLLPDDDTSINNINL